MKIRTDFVTNSSSSSFVTITVLTRDGNAHLLDLGMDVCLEEDNIPHLEGNELFCYDYDFTPNAITSVADLMACMCFSSSSEGVPFEIGSAVFAFLVGDLSPRKLKNKLKNEEGFEALEDIDPEDYEDADEMREAIMEVLPECLEEYGFYMDGCGDALIDTCIEVVKSVKNLSDIKSIEYAIGESNWGECTNDYSASLEDILESEEFSAVSTDDPSYQEEFEKWLNILENDILCSCELLDESFEDLVKKALASGSPYDMIPDTVVDAYDIKLEIPEDIICDNSATGKVRKTAFKCDEDVTEILFEGKIFVLTGHDGETERAITEIIESRGGEVKSSTVLKTDYLVVNENYKESTTKYKRALELREKGKDIKIITSQQFYALSQK